MEKISLIIVDDLHLEGRSESMRTEFANKLTNSIQDVTASGNTPILICAGDISEGTNGIDWVKQFTCDIIYVCGNHEFWHGDYYETIDNIKSKIKEENLSRIKFLHNETVTLYGVKFVGATLWTDLGEEWPWVKRNYIVNHFMSMADFKQITARRFYRNVENIEKMTAFLSENGIDNNEITDLIAEERFNPYIEIEEHNKSVDFIENTLIDGFSGKTIVVTHHLPVADFWMKKFGMKDTVTLAQYINNRAIYQEYQKKKIPPEKDVLMMGFYVNNLHHLLDHNLSPDIWVHGHFHKQVDGYIGSTRIVSSPVGYMRQGNQFSCKVIDIDKVSENYSKNMLENIEEFEWEERILDNLEEFATVIVELQESVTEKNISIDTVDKLVKMYKKQHDKNIKDLEQYVSGVLYNLVKIGNKETNITDQLYITSYISGFAKWASKNGRIGLDPISITVSDHSFISENAYKKLKDRPKNEHYLTWVEDINKIREQTILFKKTLLDYFLQYKGIEEGSSD